MLETIVKLFTALIAQLERLNANLEAGGANTAQASAPAAPAKAAPAKAVTKKVAEPVALQYADVQPVAIKFVSHYGKPELTKILKEFGVEKLSEAVDSFAGIKAKLEEKIAEAESI